MFAQIQFSKSGGTKLLLSAGAKFYQEIENHSKLLIYDRVPQHVYLRRTIDTIESKVFNLSAYFRRKKGDFQRTQKTGWHFWHRYTLRITKINMK